MRQVTSPWHHASRCPWTVTFVCRTMTAQLGRLTEVLDRKRESKALNCKIAFHVMSGIRRLRGSFFIDKLIDGASV